MPAKSPAFLWIAAKKFEFFCKPLPNIRNYSKNQRDCFCALAAANAASAFLTALRF